MEWALYQIKAETTNVAIAEFGLRNEEQLQPRMNANGHEWGWLIADGQW